MNENRADSNYALAPTHTQKGKKPAHLGTSKGRLLKKRGIAVDWPVDIIRIHSITA